MPMIAMGSADATELMFDPMEPAVADAKVPKVER
jgi:hypothetical protein